ncbi:MAG: sulfite exporter TauE/SafE family protein [Labedaea sp.]
MTGAALVVAAFVTGILNTASGGGAIVSFLAMTAIGTPPLTAHATSQLVTPMSFLTAARHAGQHRPAAPLLVAGCAGTVAGVAVLALTPPATFVTVAPFVLVSAVVLVVVQGGVKRRVDRSHPVLRPRASAVAMLACGLYAGLIGVGCGTLVLVVLGLASRWPAGSLASLMHTRNVVLLGMALLVAAAFATTGLVDWHAAALLALPGIAGGWLGTKLAGHLPEPVLRAGIAATALGGAIWMVFR